MRFRRRSRYGYRSRLRHGAASLVLVIVLGLVAGTGSLLAAAALWLDPVRVATRTVVVAEPPDVVWQLLLDLDGQPAWRRGVTRIERLPDLGGQPAWLEFNGSAGTAMRIADAQPPRRLVTEALVPGASRASWSWDLARTATGSRVTVTRRVTLADPLRRALSGLLGWTGREVDRAVTDLADRLTAADRQRITALNR